MMRSRRLICATLVPVGLAILCAPAHAQQEPPQTVSTLVVHASDWRETLDVVGSLRAVHGADLAAEVPGIVDHIGFESGADVAAGAVLMRLRANDDPAKLAELQAQADLARANLARDEKQLRVSAVSQAAIDADHAALRAADARVAQQQALIEEKTIRAPFAGKLGLRQVDPGQYLQAGTMVVTLQALDQLYVDFYVPQQALAKLRAGTIVAVGIDAFPGRAFAALIAAISPKLDSQSRMAQVRATIGNADHALSPGMFATVSVGVGDVQHYVTLPNAAVIYNTYGSAVYVVVAGNPATVRQALIKTGATRGDQVAVTAGLRDGDQVVTAGQIKLRPGSAITINNAVQPANQPAPNPREG